MNGQSFEWAWRRGAGRTAGIAYLELLTTADRPDGEKVRNWRIRGRPTVVQDKSGCRAGPGRRLLRQIRQDLGPGP